MQAKEKERRMRMREEKLLQQRQAQEERLRKALERAQAAPTKKVYIYSKQYYYTNTHA